jgi:hypothetical protein
MQTAEMPLIILGWCSLVYGVTELVNSLKIWRVRKQAEKGAVPRNDDDTSVAEEISSTLGTDD